MQSAAGKMDRWPRKSPKNAQVTAARNCATVSSGGQHRSGPIGPAYALRMEPRWSAMLPAHDVSEAAAAARRFLCVAICFSRILLLATAAESVLVHFRVFLALTAAAILLSIPSSH